MARHRAYYRRRRQAKAQEAITMGYVVTALAITAIILNFSNGESQDTPTLLYVLMAIGAAVVAGVFAFSYLQLHRRRRRMMLLTMADVDHMPGIQFEHYVAELFRRQGYHIQLTPVNDYGVDIIIARDGVRTAVQVKRYSKPVAQEAVREAIAGMAFHACSQSMVVTNSSFTKAAIMLAKVNDCVLINREELAKLATAVQPKH